MQWKLRTRLKACRGSRSLLLRILSATSVANLSIWTSVCCKSFLSALAGRAEAFKKLVDRSRGRRGRFLFSLLLGHWYAAEVMRLEDASCPALLSIASVRESQASWRGESPFSWVHAGLLLKELFQP